MCATCPTALWESNAKQQIKSYQPKTHLLMMEITFWVITIGPTKCKRAQILKKNTDQADHTWWPQLKAMSFFFLTQTGHTCQKFMSTTNILVHTSKAKCCSESTIALCKVAQQYGKAKLEQRIKKDWLGGQPVLLLRLSTSCKYSLVL